MIISHSIMTCKKSYLFIMTILVSEFDLEYGIMIHGEKKEKKKEKTKTEHELESPPQTNMHSISNSS